MLLIGAIAIAIGIIAIVIYRSLNTTKRQKQIIEKQKQLVEEKQKEILDSIHYAKRIQMALLTSEYYIEKQLKRLKP
jgi:signal transduction histidine kinase